MRHEILNEIGREKVFADILEWLNKRAGVARPE
jgi:alpha-beta hydrolase superfamily lysophospholipase